MLAGAISAGTTTEQPGTTVAAPSPKLVRAAQQFEGMMLEELLKPMTEDDGLGGDDSGSDSGAGSGGALSTFATGALGQALSAGGGLGIAHEIIGSFSQSGNRRSSGKVTGDLHRNTVMRALK